MSKLIEKLNQVAKAGPQSIGFRSTQPASAKPKILLIASLVQTDSAGSLTDYTAGADAVLITKLGPGAKTTEKITRSFPDIPWGLQLGDISAKDIEPMLAAGCDFIVFPTDIAPAIPGEGKMGKILQIEPSLSEGLLRAVNELPVDAVLLADQPGEKPFLTWHHLMLFRRFADLSSKPMLASLPPNVSQSELGVLWETGVVGVVVKVGMGQPAGRLKELRQTIDRLTFPPRQGQKIEALLPHIGEETSPVSEAEEEEEEEEP